MKRVLIKQGRANVKVKLSHKFPGFGNMCSVSCVSELDGYLSFVSVDVLVEVPMRSRIALIPAIL